MAIVRYAIVGAAAEGTIAPISPIPQTSLFYRRAIGKECTSLNYFRAVKRTNYA